MSSEYLISMSAMLLARWVAGPERDDWVRAMAAEWESLERGRAGWAIGCLGAALSDRLRREWRPAALALCVMPLIVVWNAMAMSQIAPLLRETGAALPGAWIVAYLLNPLPLVLLLGYLVPRRARFIGFATGAMFLFAPFAASVLLLGVPVRAWVGLGPMWLASYPIALGLWTAVAAFGARQRQRRRTAR